jgi:hypothetical protein
MKHLDKKNASRFMAERLTNVFSQRNNPYCDLVFCTTKLLKKYPYKQIV